MSFCNILCLILGLSLLGAGYSATAEEQQAPALAWADGEAAFDWVQSWVRSDKNIPEQAQLPDRPVSELFGVYVTLRDSGRVLGRGQAIREDIAKAIDQPGPAVQLAPLLLAATRQALDELRDKQMKRAVELKIDDPEIFKQGLIAMRERVQVDVQLGYNLTSIVLPQDAQEDAAFHSFAPGFHGLRMAGPLTGASDYAWPAIELARNASPPRILFRLLEDQGYTPKDMAMVARGDGPALQRFDVIHVVRPAQGQPMRHLTRGNLILQQQVIDGRTIAGLAERSARYLDQLIVWDETVGRLGMRGTYQPSLERYAPAWAGEREAALVSYAMTRQARVAIETDENSTAPMSRAQRAIKLVEQLAPAAAPEGLAPQHLTAAFCLLTLCETPVKLLPDQLVLRDRLGQALLQLHHPEGGGFRVEAGSDKRLSRATAAVLAYALASWYERTRSQTLVEPTWSVLSDLMEANKDDPRVIDLLWVNHALGRAGALLAAAHPKPDEAPKQLAAWQHACADYLDLLGEQQLRSKPVLGPEDVLGGFILEPAPSGSPPNPSWQSAMPLAYFALALRNPDMVPADKTFGPLLSAGLGARFIAQLMFSPSATYYLRDTEPVIGGVRSTLWDNTLYPDCSAMALIALSELQQTLHALEPKQQDE